MTGAAQVTTRLDRASPGRHSPARCLLCAAVFIAALASIAMPVDSWAQSAAVPRTVKSERPEQGARWSDLKPAQRSVLEPLERDWSGIDAPQKQKWLELSARFPGMSPDEQARVQTRMSEWAKLTPPERGQARMRFQEAKSLPATDRQARWDAYQALPPEQRQQLAARARASAPSVAASGGASNSASSGAATKAGAAAARTANPARDLPQVKSNVVPNPAFAAAPVPITPTEVQARPGVTTTPISRRPRPPSHQQAGLPKIAATPEFVNRATLLPQRGPQGAATRPAAAASSPAAAAVRR